MVFVEPSRRMFQSHKAEATNQRGSGDIANVRDLQGTLETYSYLCPGTGSDHCMPLQTKLRQMHIYSRLPGKGLTIIDITQRNEHLPPRYLNCPLSPALCRPDLDPTWTSTPTPTLT